MKRYNFYPLNHQSGNRIEADDGEYVAGEVRLRLQSELTKARELIKEQDDFLYLLNGHDSYARIPHKYGKQCHEVVDDLRAKLCGFLANQSAPAAKGNTCQDGGQYGLGGFCKEL